MALEAMRQAEARTEAVSSSVRLTSSRPRSHRNSASSRGLGARKTAVTSMSTASSLRKRA